MNYLFIYLFLIAQRGELARDIFEEEKRLMEVRRKKLMLINYSLMTCHLFSFHRVEKKIKRQAEFQCTQKSKSI